MQSGNKRNGGETQDNYFLENFKFLLSSRLCDYKF